MFEKDFLMGLVHKLPTFRLGDKEYGLDILKVQEIIGMQKIISISRIEKAVKVLLSLEKNIVSG